MKVTIGDIEIPERLLLYVTFSVGAFPVSFGGIVHGEEAQYIRKRLKLLAEERAIWYEAVDKNGVFMTGICTIKDLKFEETPTSPVLVKFSARLVHPFI